MITLTKDKCIPQSRKLGEPPDYICTPSGKKHYLSGEEKKDYLYGGSCPVICPFDNRGNCPNVDYVTDQTVAKQQCETNNECHFISNSVMNRMGPNYCLPKQQKNCITLRESDLAKSDKILTDSESVCNRLNKGCIFNRGNGERKGNPVCLRGCLGSKYWNNPKYIWGGGQGYKGGYDFNDLQLGPRYLEASPTNQKPNGWGGIGLLPKTLGIAYTESRGKYSPPCNISEGDVGAFTGNLSGENLAGPGCQLTPPQPQYGMQDWSYTCRCPYSGSLEVRSDAWKPCEDYQLDESKPFTRDVCEGCYIQDNPKQSFYGHCVLGNEIPDTESKILGCVPDKKFPDKCRVNRIVEPTECPSFCSENPLKPDKWRTSTQCSQQLANKCWTLNPAYRNTISLEDRRLNKQAPPYLKGPQSGSSGCNKKNTDYLCQNCSTTSIKTIGTGTQYPNRSYCVVGGNDSFSSSDDYGLGRKLQCPSTCRQCLTGFFNEPLKPIYNLNESINPNSAFAKGILFVPWVGEKANKELQFKLK